MKMIFHTINLLYASMVYVLTFLGVTDNSIIQHIHSQKLDFHASSNGTRLLSPAHLCERGFLPGSVGGLQAPTNWIRSSVIQVWSLVR